MKGFLKHIALAFTAILTLTACDNLLNMMPHRQSNYDSSSSLRSQVNQDDAPPYEVFCNENGTIYISSNETYTTNFYLWDASFGAKVKILEDSYVTCSNKNLDASYNAFYSYLEVTFFSNEIGVYNVDVVLISSEGFTYERTFEVDVIDSADNCHLEINGPLNVTIGKTSSLDIRIFDPIYGRYVSINQEFPFNMDYGSDIVLDGFYFPDEYTISIQFRGVRVGSGLIKISVQSNTGFWYIGTTSYQVKQKQSNNRLVCEVDPIIVETGSYADICFYLIDQDGSRVEIQTNGFDLGGLNDDFTFTLLNFDPYYLKIRFNNVNPAGGGSDFSLSVIGADLNEYTSYFHVYSRSYYENARLMYLDVKAVGNNRYCLSIYVTRLDGAYCTITSAHIKARNGIVCDEETIENLWTIQYDHYFTLKAHGEDVIDVDVGTSDNVWVGSAIYVTL